MYKIIIRYFSTAGIQTTKSLENCQEITSQVNQNPQFQCCQRLGRLYVICKQFFSLSIQADSSHFLTLRRKQAFYIVHK